MGALQATGAYAYILVSWIAVFVQMSVPFSHFSLSAPHPRYIRTDNDLVRSATLLGEVVMLTLRKVDEEHFCAFHSASWISSSRCLKIASTREESQDCAAEISMSGRLLLYPHSDA